MARTQSCACCGSAADAGSDGATADMTCYCPVEGVIETVGRKYAMQIVALVGAEGPMRFGEFKSRLDVTSDSTLTAQLDKLQAEDLIARRSYDEVPPRVEYSLTAKGRELEERLRPLLEWAAHDDD